MTNPSDIDVTVWLRERIEDTASRRGWTIESIDGGVCVSDGVDASIVVVAAPPDGAPTGDDRVYVVADPEMIADSGSFVLGVDDSSPETVRNIGLALCLAQSRRVARNTSCLFDSFLRAAVRAVEQRDPTSSGHAFRVAALTKRLAEAVNAQADGPLGNLYFDEEALHAIEIAALVHDFGKVNVREEVLVKAKKLYPPTLKVIRSRFDFVKRSIENDHLHRRLMMMEDGTPAEELAILDAACERAVGDIEDCWRIICSANEPTVLPEGDFAKIEEIANRTYFDLGGHRQPFLEETEMASLIKARGSLTPEELEEIRAHASHTGAFLRQIPWPRSLSSVPRIACSHHEKLDGSGYPAKLTGEQIPIESRMMAVADIFDALTAADRPYKKAVTLERALDILTMEARDRHIDKALVELFVREEVYTVTSERENGGEDY